VTAGRRDVRRTLRLTSWVPSAGVLRTGWAVRVPAAEGE